MNWLKNILGIKPSKAEFVEIAKSFIKQSVENADIVYDHERISLSAREPDGSIGSVRYLENAYVDYCAAPQAVRGKVLEAYLSKPQEVPSSLDESMANILPRIQVRSFFEEMIVRQKIGEMQVLQAGSGELPFTVIAEHYAKGLIFDTPQSVLYIDTKKYAGWNKSIEDLMPAALSNLKHMTPQPMMTLSPGVYMSPYNDNHDATRLLLTDWIKECKVQGRHVAMMPNRDALIITGESDPEGITLMLNTVEKVLKLPRPMLAIPLVLSETEWHVWQPNLNHPERKRLDHLHTVSMMDVYNAQKALLDRLHEKEDRDIFVATYNAMKKADTGETSSSAAWTEDVATLLPVVDKIVLVRLVGEKPNVLGIVPWTNVMTIAGDLLKPVGSYPERYEVQDFPSELQLAQLLKYAER